MEDGLFHLRNPAGNRVNDLRHDQNLNSNIYRKNIKPSDTEITWPQVVT